MNGASVVRMIVQMASEFSKFVSVGPMAISRAFDLVSAVFLVAVSFAFAAQLASPPSCVIHMKGRPPDVSIRIEFYSPSFKCLDQFVSCLIAVETRDHALSFDASVTTRRLVIQR